MSNLTSASGEASVSSNQQQSSFTSPIPTPIPAPKKKRNLPGNPDPEAEVIALSPKSLMDRSLQLQRRCHNLPLKEIRKKAYFPTTSRSTESTNRNPTNVDASSFRETVQMLTGSAGIPSNPIHPEKGKRRPSHGSSEEEEARKKFVRCKTTTKQGNSVDDFSTCQVIDSEMLPFGAVGGELPAATAVESSSGLASVGSTGQRQSKKRKKRMWTVRVSATQTGNMVNLPDDGYTWRKYVPKDIQNDILCSKFPRVYFRCARWKRRNWCSAKKIVQRDSETPDAYEVTYVGDHTCQTSTKPGISESERPEHLQQVPEESLPFFR